MSTKNTTSILATLLLAFATLFAVQPTAQASSTSCLPGSVKAKLTQIRAKFGPVSIVSTHRPGARIAGSGKRSYHASCRAVDFHPPRGKYRQVVAWLKSNHSGGVGTYSCGMHHVHIDNGPRVRFHHCVNASGRPVGKKRHYARGKSKKQYAKKRYAKKAYAGKKRTASKKAAKRYVKKSSGKVAKKAVKKRSQHAANERWGVNKYAAF